MMDLLTSLIFGCFMFLMGFIWGHEGSVNLLGHNQQEPSF